MIYSHCCQVIGNIPGSNHFSFDKLQTLILQKYFLSRGMTSLAHDLQVSWIREEGTGRYSSQIYCWYKIQNIDDEGDGWLDEIQ